MFFKKFKSCKLSQLLVSLLLIASILLSIIGYAKISSKADNQTLKRDTKVSVDSSGNLKISRSDKALKPMGKKDSWTLFVYMTGSDLESDYENATADIKEMFEANYGKEHLDKLNIIIQTGGSTNWHTEGIDSNKIQRFRVVGNELEQLQTLDLVSMGSSYTLYNFLDWGISNYASEHMGLIFWNHGSGVSKGLCVDTNFNYDSLSLGEVEYSLAKLGDKLTDKFEIIGFDTCLSGSLEYANVLAPYGKYMVASADIEPGDGWDYTPIINYIVANPDADGLEVGVVIADSYYDYYTSDNITSEYTTMAVYDLSQVDDACIETNKYAKFMYETIKNDLKNNDKLTFFFNSAQTYECINADIGAILAELDNGEYFSYNTSSLKKAFEKLVVYNKIGSTYVEESCNGITIYCPDVPLTYAELNTYRNVAFSPYWMNFLELASAATMDSSLESYTANNWESSKYYFEDNFDFIKYESFDSNTEESYKLLLKNTDYANADFPKNWYTLFKKYNSTTYEEFTNPYYDNPGIGPGIGFGPGLEISRINNSITGTLNSTAGVANLYTAVFNKLDEINILYLGDYANVSYDNKTGTFTSPILNQWFTLPDGQLLTTKVIANEKDGIIYGFPVVIKDVESTIRIKETKKADGTKEYTLLGVWDATINSSYSPRGFLPLDIGTKITPIYDVYNTESNSYETVYGEEYTITSDFDFLFTTLDDDNYSFSICVDKVLGKNIYSQLLDFSIVNGSIHNNK